MTAQNESVESMAALRRRSRRKRSPMVAVVAAALSAVLIASTFIATTGTASPADAAGSSVGTVTGTVFQNFLSSGWKQPAAAGTPASRPVAGVTATAYDAQGDVVGSAVSKADGDYSITVEDAYSDALRVEFSGWTAPLEPAFAAQGTAPKPLPAANDTSVQFVTLDAGNVASGVDFGLIEPEAVIQANAPIATAVQSAGVRTGNSAQLPSLVAQPWLMEGEAPASANAISKLATFTQTGAVWGMAYSRQANDLFLAASLKRMSDLGPLGLGGIYRTQDMLAPNGSVSTGAATAGWFTFSGLPVSNADNAPLDIGASLSPTALERNLANAGTPRREFKAFALAGRIGLGGLATAPDGSRLFAANLFDGDVYGVDISNPQGAAPSSTYRITTPVGSTQAIWAVHVEKGRLYIGYVDTGDKSAGVPDPGQSAASKGMSAYVASTPLDSVLSAPGSAPAWTRELTVDLGYAKGSNIQNWTSNVGNPNQKFEKAYPRLRQWNSWTDTWQWKVGGADVAVGMIGSNKGVADNLHAYPQAILSSIAFDVDGYLNLGFLDRTSVQSGNRSYGALSTGTELWSSMSNGDVLVAAPATQWEAAGEGCPTAAPSERYVLECAGKVGDRAVRTAATPEGQRPTYNDVEGPGGGEFFNDRRNLGTEKGAQALNHNEITLGSVVSFPGLPEVATTAMDPRSQAYHTGLMWFDERTGAATRGIDLVGKGILTNGNAEGSTSFQKSGGLGDTALLAQLAPVEIGNRVWLDADLNGRQDADEPAINGAVVELWTADAEGNAVDRIASRTTATIDGQPGTYYFRTDDADVVAGTNAHPFVANASYVLVFTAGTTLTLAGPNAGNAGFAGLAWSDLQRTSAEVRVAPTASTGGTTATNDSNPDVTTGHHPFTVGGPGQNNHSYDAGWYSTNTYGLAKAFNPGTAVVPAGTSYGFTVVAAENFRGEKRLAAGGPGSPGDPRVTEDAFTLASPWAWSAQQALPLGYRLTLAEADAAAGSVTWSTPVAGNSARGQVTITPKRGAQASALLTATNQFGGFTVNKTLSGPAAAAVSPDVRFQLEYKLGDGEASTAWVSKATPFALDSLPLGTAVKIKESSPIVTDPAEVPGVVWGTPSWSAVQGVTGPDADGWYSFTISPATPNLALSVNNVATPLTAGFSILKVRAPGEALPNQAFNFEYKIGAGTALPLGPIKAGDSASTPKTIVYGSKVSVREIAPVNTNALTWERPIWSGLPAGASGPDADGWYSFTFTPASAAGLALTATNKSTEVLTGFSVTKKVTATGSPSVAGRDYALEYRTVPAQPGQPIALTLKAGETWTSPVDQPVGTVVELREVQPANTPGIAWAAPVWTVNDAAATVANGWTRFTLNSAATARFEVENRPREVFGGFSLQKAFDGTGVQHVSALGYPVMVQIGSDAPQPVTLPGSGAVVAPAEWDGLPIGTIVKVKEVTPLPAVAGISWGSPSWSASAGTALTEDSDGWTVFEITSDDEAAALTVTNKPTEEFGRFQVTKTVATNGNPVAPASYTVEYKLDDAAPVEIELAAGEHSAIIDNLPFGTVVTMREVDPAVVAGVDWAKAWTIDGAASTPDAAGWVTFTVSDTTLVALEVTNTFTQRFGKFQVAKTVTGNGQTLVPAGTPFVFEYTLDGGDAQQLTATPAQASKVIGDLPYGTEVTITEVAFPEIPGIEFNENPGWTLNGAPVSAPVTFTIDGSALVALSVQNTASKVYGTFSLTKAITGDGASRVPDSASFAVEYSSDGGTSWNALDPITKGSPSIESPEFLVGTHILLREAAPSAGADFSWGTPAFIVDGAPQGTRASFTIDAKGPAPAVSVRLENPAVPLDGTFTVEKRVAGDFALTDPELAGLSFTADWSGGGRTGSIVLNAANDWTAGPGGAEFPKGTEITLTEAAVTGLPANVQFEKHSWLAGVPGVTVSGDGRTATLIVGSGTPARLVLRNEFTELRGSFEVEKLITGDFAANDPEFAELAFLANWSGGGRNGSIVLNAANDWKGGPGGAEFPKGTEITLTEAAVTGLPANVAFERHSWRPGVPGVTVSGDGRTATLVVGSGAPAQLALGNEFSELFGSFEVEKLITGDFTAADPEFAGLSFTAEWSGDGRTGSIALNAANDWTAGPGGAEFPTGTEITLTEAAVTGLPANVQFDRHSWLTGVPGVTVSADGRTATLTVGSGTPAHLVLDNEFSRLTGSFTVNKAVTGDFALTDTELRALTFTANWSGGGRTGSIGLNAANNWTSGPSGPPFQRGTQITLTEAAVTGLPAHVQFDRHSWLTGVPGVAVSADGRTATLTVDSGTPAQLSLVNAFTKREGTFQVEKVVDGDFTLGDQELKDLSFTARYAASDGSRGSLVLNAAGGWTAVSGRVFPAGTTVTVTEVAVDQSSLAPNVQWGGYRWLPGSGHTVSADGATATIVIAGDSTAALTLRNSFREVEGSFLVQKSVEGDFALTDPGLRGQRFLVAYTASNGAAGTLDLNARNGWSAGADELPAGTVVTLTELAPAGLGPDVRWDGSRWAAGSGVTVSADGKTATLTVRSDGAPVRLTVENSFTQLTGSFSVEKVVEGDFALTSPELSGLSFSVPYSASTGATGRLALNAAGGWAAAPGKEFPLGTVITVTEADVTGLPAHVRWDGYSWLAGAGYTVSDDGASASFTVGAQPVEPRLVLQNRFAKLLGGFELTKKVTGAAAELVPDDLAFTAEFSLDDGASWKALPAVTKGAPVVAGPGDIPLGTTVLIREIAPAAVEGVTWGAPAFSGVGVTPGAGGGPGSFVVGSHTAPVQVVLSNPTTPSNGQFQVLKKITGAGAALLKGEPVFTVKYSYAGQTGAGQFEIRAGEFASSEPIAVGTVVTITEVAPRGGLVDGASWGAPVLVLENGTVLANGATITIGADTVLQLRLENPTQPPLPSTGFDGLGAGVLLSILLGATGLLFLLFGGRRRRLGAHRG